MKTKILLVVLLIATLSGCKNASVDSEISKPTDIQVENVDWIKKIIEGNTIKSHVPEKNARTSGSSTWYFTNYGYKTTTPGSSSYNTSVYVSNGNNFPITLTIYGQLIISNQSLSASTSGCYYYADENGTNIVLGPGNYATLSFTANINSNSFEGYSALKQTSPFIVNPINTDDFLYLTKGI